MGTVGIAFGSATSGQGFDVATTVTQIQAAEAGIETPWTTQLTSLKAQDTAFTNLGTDLSTLTTALQTLTDFTGVLSEKQGASSDTNLLELTGATSAATAGSHTIVVSSLAENSSEYTGAVANAADTLSGGITIQIGSGAAQTVNVVSGTSDTLNTLAAAINIASLGVTASVITDSSGSRLSLVSGTNGAAGQLTVTSSLTDSTAGTALGFSVGQTGVDASLTVDGISLTSASNTVTNAIPGVTFQLLSASPATQIQVQITNDTADVSTAVAALVTAYNAVIKDINTQEGNDATGNPEPLFGNPALTSIQETLSTALLAGSASGRINSITQLGIAVNNDGTLTLDTDTLQNALTTNFADVTGYLQDTGSFGQTFAATLNELGTQAPTGAVYLALAENSSVEANLTTNVTNEDALLAAQKISLTAELNTANQVLQSIPAQLAEINEIYSAVTGYNSTQNG
jgi:flagellar hook-associated protein 2